MPSLQKTPLRWALFLIQVSKTDIDFGVLPDITIRLII